MTLVGIGLAVGIAAAVGFTRVISTMLFGVSAHDVAIFAGVPLLLAVAGLAASLIPAYRATRVDPLICLRTE
jgi:ABC-type antimicrobial peptide transport system permease subunit